MASVLAWCHSLLGCLVGVLLLLLLAVVNCGPRRLCSRATHNVDRRHLPSEEEDDDDDLPLKDAAPFPIGTVWSSGHTTWGRSKGTDLGGSSDVFAPGTFISEEGLDFSTIVQKTIDETAEHGVLRTQFDSLTSEVALKPHNVAARGPRLPDDLDFREADALLAFAQEHGLRVHGHVLLFGMSVPTWALEYEAENVWTTAQWEDWLQTYIATVVGRYRGRIASWDVLNEGIETFGGDYRTESMFWWRVLGDDYIEKAFRWAEQADPDAKLFINESLMDLLPGKLRLCLDLANDLRSRGVKVDGIGFQGHLLDGLFQAMYSSHKQAYKAASDEGYLVHISELDLAVNLFGLFQGKQNAFQHRIQRQGYNSVARAYRDGVAPENQYGITLWNVSDPNSFLNIVKFWFDIRFLGGTEYPLLWDADYNPKPAYYGFRNGLQGIAEG